MTSGVYAVMHLVLGFAQTRGLIASLHWEIFRWVSLSGLAIFYLCLRSGWSKRLADRAMTAQQMMFAIVMLAGAYVAAPAVRGAMLVVVPMVLTFGGFTLPPRRCQQMGAFAVGVQAIAMGLSFASGAQGQGGAVEVMVFVACAVVFAMSADMAGRLSAMREQLRFQKRELRAALERNAQLARQDELTQLPNRRHALEMMEYEGRRAQRDKVPPCICMMDIDHFKHINDTHGHAAGDVVLRLLASHAVPALRAPDILARWGGEEFILIMPETSLEIAIVVVERLRCALANAHIWKDRPELKVTFSAGIASMQASESIQDTVARADAALYRAKEGGRNRTEQA
jgi:diguanylate cyclase (GGDEF)-like protein